MSRAQEAQRAVMSEVEAAGVKKAEDISKDISKKVRQANNICYNQFTSPTG
jgi:homeobox protein cut-like